MNLKVLLGLLPCFLLACRAETGPSGAAATETSLAALTDEEAAKLCEWSIRTEGGPGFETKCGETTSVTHTQAECMESLKALRGLDLPCPMTVGDAEGCSVETQNDPCPQGARPACDRINACAAKGTKK